MHGFHKKNVISHAESAFSSAKVQKRKHVFVKPDVNERVGFEGYVPTENGNN